MLFAPTILDVAADEYLENPRRLEAPYMILTFDTKVTGRDGIVAATHQADHTARPQVLTRDQTPGYYDVITAFRRRTGVGAVLNTSFNLHGDPIVDTPEQAVEVMERSGLKHLALGEWLISKRSYEPTNAT
jgi:carbamoyltransferase